MSTLNAYVGGAWVPVDLRGPTGDVGPQGPAGVFTWPVSNFRTFTGSFTGGDTVNECPLTIAASGSNPATKVNGADNRRVEVIRAGVLAMTYLVDSTSQSLGWGSWLNIRRQADDAIMAMGQMVPGETRLTVESAVPVNVGDIFRFYFAKQTGGTHAFNVIVRTALLV